MKINFFEYIKKRQKSSLKSELLSKALGAKQGLRVLDGTAGLGRDAIVLASLNYVVVALEKNQTLFKMLESAYNEAHGNPKFFKMCQNLEFKNLDFFSIQDASHYDVIYLDPMFPEKKKSALPGKEMQYLQELLSNEEANDQNLLEHALKLGSKRVVIKRPAKGEVLIPSPQIQYKGKTVRFDVYIK